MFLYFHFNFSSFIPLPQSQLYNLYKVKIKNFKTQKKRAFNHTGNLNTGPCALARSWPSPSLISPPSFPQSRSLYPLFSSLWRAPSRVFSFPKNISSPWIGQIGINHWKLQVKHEVLWSYLILWAKSTLTSPNACYFILKLYSLKELPSYNDLPNPIYRV